MSIENLIIGEPGQDWVAKINNNANKLDDKVGDLTTLTTANKTNIVNAIKENTTNIANNTAQLSDIVQEQSTQNNNINVHTTQISNIKTNIGMFVESVSLADCVDMKSLGVGYVIYYYYNSIGLTNGLTQIRYFASVGINVIVSLASFSTLADLTSVINNFKNEPNVTGWYLYDEADSNLISIADQETKLANVKTLSGLMCCISCNSNYGVDRRISTKFDLYFISNYIVDSQYTTFTDEIDIKMCVLQVHNSIGALVGIDRCVPILQAFARSGIFYGTQIQMETLYRNQLSVYKNSPCFFIYSADTTNPTFNKTIKSDGTLKSIVKKIIDSCVNGTFGKDKVICKTTIRKIFGADVSVSDYLTDIFELINTAYSIGKFQVNGAYPTNLACNGFYPTPTGGKMVLDLGRKIKHLDIKLKVQNIYNGDSVTVNIDKLYTPTLGVNIATATFSSSYTFHVIKKDFNCRYLSVYFTNSFDAGHDQYLVFNDLQLLGITQ